MCSPMTANNPSKLVARSSPTRRRRPPTRHRSACRHGGRGTARSQSNIPFGFSQLSPPLPPPASVKREVPTPPEGCRLDGDDEAFYDLVNAYDCQRRSAGRGELFGGGRVGLHKHNHGWRAWWRPRCSSCEEEDKKKRLPMTRGHETIVLTICGKI